MNRDLRFEDLKEYAIPKNAEPTPRYTKSIESNFETIVKNPNTKNTIPQNVIVLEEPVGFCGSFNFLLSGGIASFF